ncbi:hypothetical protein [Sphingobacterium kyonggiense]
MKNQLKFIIGLLVMLLVISCKKGEYINNSQEFSTIKLYGLNVNERLKSVSIDGVKYTTNPFLTIFQDKDSIELSLEFEKSKFNFKKKVLNKKKNEDLLYYFNNLKDSTLTIGPHPLSSVSVPNGKIAMKVFGENDRYSEKTGIMHLAVYKSEGEIKMGQPVKYSDKPIDTILNINNNIPEKFYFLPRPANRELIKFKFLDSKFNDLFIDGVRVYAFIQFDPNKKAFIYRIEPLLITLRRKNDPNSGLNNADGGYTVSNSFTMYMSN